MIQNTLRLHLSRLPGETQNSHSWRQRNLAADIKGHGSAKTFSPQSPGKLFADLLKREARRVMADVTECEPVQMPAHLARLDFLRELIRHAGNHELIPGNETLQSSQNPLSGAYTVADFDACLAETRKTHRAPAFVNSRDSDLAEIKQKLDTLAGCFARSSVMSAVLDEANAADAAAESGVQS